MRFHTKFFQKDIAKSSFLVLLIENGKLRKQLKNFCVRIFTQFTNYVCHLSGKIYCFSENVPSCQALSADEVYRINWRGIDNLAVEIGFTFQRLSFQLCANLCLHEIMLPQKRLPREVRHFMSETLIVLSLLASPE